MFPQKIARLFAATASALTLFVQGAPEAQAQTVTAEYPAGTSLMKGGRTDDVTKRPVNCKTLHKTSKGGYQPTKDFLRQADIEGANIGKEINLAEDEKTVLYELGQNTHAWFQHYSTAHMIGNKKMCLSQYQSLDHQNRIAVLEEKYGKGKIPPNEMPEKPVTTEISPCPPLTVYQQCVNLLKQQEPK